MSNPATTTEDAAKAPLTPLRRADGAPIVSPRTLAAILAIAEALFSKGGTPPERQRLDWLEWEMEDFLARAGAQARFVFALMTWLVTFLAPLFIGRVTALGALSFPDRVRAMTRLEKRFGEPLLAVKAILCLVYYEHPDASREVGFDGQCAVPRSSSDPRLPVVS